MEVLAVIAYNQPVTKAFVEQVRGVDCSGVIGSLVQKALIEERGRLDLPGKPLLYGTTENFLRCMGYPLAFGAAAFAAEEETKMHLKTTGQTKHDRFMGSARPHRADLSSAVHPLWRFNLNYNGEATVFIRYLFLKYRVLPAPEKKPEPEKREETKRKQV